MKNSEREREIERERERERKRERESERERGEERRGGIIPILLSRMQCIMDEVVAGQVCKKCMSVDVFCTRLTFAKRATKMSTHCLTWLYGFVLLLLCHCRECVLETSNADLTFILLKVRFTILWLTFLLSII